MIRGGGALLRRISTLAPTFGPASAVRPPGQVEFFESRLRPILPQDCDESPG